MTAADWLVIAICFASTLGLSAAIAHGQRSIALGCAMLIGLVTVGLDMSA